MSGQDGDLGRWSVLLLGARFFGQEDVKAGRGGFAGKSFWTEVGEGRLQQATDRWRGADARSGDKQAGWSVKPRPETVMVMAPYGSREGGCNLAW